MEIPEPSCSHSEHDNAELFPTDEKACEEAAELFAVLGDRNRLRLLCLLCDGERCVSELAELLDDNLPAVSQRLRLLRTHRVVRGRRAGKHVYYALDDEHIRGLIHNALAHAGEF